MRFLPSIAAALTLACATPTAAQFLGPQEGVTPEMVAKAKTEADALLNQAGAEDLFENVTEGMDPRVRHRRSGLVCSFTPGAELNKVMVFDAEEPTRGDDVGCNTTLGEVVTTYYATRYAEDYSPQFLAEDAGRAITQRWPDATPYDGMVATVKEEGNPPTSSVMFYIGSGEQRRYTHAYTARIGAWSFKQRLTAPAESAMAVQAIGGIGWNTVLRLARTNPGND
ncbi:hypothetical protein GVN21_17700 [Caulobacter sp. SLTY]|uniref:hypothetical protein n=1 Tax=Caulobacter sp. SLTY TaxID=2683262 RepID=UPI001413001E|nr:hypothetical protein [Caulobacter sp. SLTY]NBB17203.1 hypothetical protein [Caulobacter sp. SLTY]